MTHFQDFTRPDGTAVTVEYAVEGRNSPTTYSPLSGADGGDAAEFCILKAWRKDTEEDVELPDAEREGYEEWLAANIDPDDFYEPSAQEEAMTCERPGCTLDAAYRRWRADPNSQGANLNEPGIRAELLCIAHTNEVITYLGSWGIEPLDPAAEPPTRTTVTFTCDVRRHPGAVINITPPETPC